MRTRRLMIGVAVLLALGAGFGTYFALRGPDYPPVPEAEQSQILEQAKAEGVISSYRVRLFQPDYRGKAYEVGGGEIQLRSFANPCGGDASRPSCLSISPPLMVLEYRHAAAEQARAIVRIAQKRFPNARIKTFEVTTLGG